MYIIFQIVCKFRIKKLQPLKYHPNIINSFLIDPPKKALFHCPIYENITRVR